MRNSLNEIVKQINEQIKESNDISLSKIIRSIGKQVQDYSFEPLKYIEYIRQEILNADLSMFARGHKCMMFNFEGSLFSVLDGLEKQLSTVTGTGTNYYKNCKSVCEEYACIFDENTPKGHLDDITEQGRQNNDNEVIEQQSRNKTSVATPPSHSQNKSPKQTFFDLMLLSDVEQRQKLFDALSRLLINAKGKYAAMVFLVCVKHGLMTRPSHSLLTATFGDIGHPSGYNNYYSKGLGAYTQEEIKGIETRLNEFIDSN